MSAILPKGTVIAGLQVRSPLGQGGFGITYLAVDTKNRRKLALKEYFPSDHAVRQHDGTVRSKTDDKKIFNFGLEAFITEANLLKSLPREKGLVRVRGAFEKMGTAYCVMEYIEGDPLDRMITRLVRAHGHVPEELIRDLLDPILNALRAIHEKKLIHRDIKPGNVMIRRSGDPVLIDFGAAKSYGKRLDGVVMYTKKYAPIEQFPEYGTLPLKGLTEGPWSDLYSLCVMLYEILNRCAPPDALTRMKILHETGKDPYVPLSTALAGERYSSELLDLIDSGCQLLPQNRPASAMEIGAEYKRTFATNTRVLETGFAEDPPKSNSLAKRPKTAVRTGKKVRSESRSTVMSKILMGLLILGLAALSIGYGLWDTL
jgi:serine/threonine protein kinase